MLFLSLSILFSIITTSTLTPWPIRHTKIDILEQHTYLVNHPANQIGLGLNSLDLRSCIYNCDNHDFCRTAVFQSQLLVCFLFEECSNFGQIVPDAQATLISFQVCNNEPENVAFSPPVIESIPVATIMSNLIWITYLAPVSNSWFPLFMNDQIYVPLQNTINIYETDTYTLVRTISIPAPSGIRYLRGDSQGTLIYSQNNDFNFYIYSLQTNIVTNINSSFSDFWLCYSMSFIVIVPSSLNVADVYLRSHVNNSATFIYRINGWNQLRHCVIINDQNLIGALQGGGLQTTMLSKTSYNATVITLTLNSNYTPTSAAVNIDAAGRLYTAPSWSYQMSTVYLPDGTLIGTHQNTRDSVGRSSKYKFIFLTSDGNQVSVYEYNPYV